MIGDGKQKTLKWLVKTRADTEFNFQLTTSENSFFLSFQNISILHIFEEFIDYL